MYTVFMIEKIGLGVPKSDEKSREPYIERVFESNQSGGVDTFKHSYNVRIPGIVEKVTISPEELATLGINPSDSSTIQSGTDNYSKLIAGATEKSRGGSVLPPVPAAGSAAAHERHATNAAWQRWIKHDMYGVLKSQVRVDSADQDIRSFIEKAKAALPASAQTERDELDETWKAVRKLQIPTVQKSGESPEQFEERKLSALSHKLHKVVDSFPPHVSVVEQLFPDVSFPKKVDEPSAAPAAPAAPDIIPTAIPAAVALPHMLHHDAHDHRDAHVTHVEHAAHEIHAGVHGAGPHATHEHGHREVSLHMPTLRDAIALPFVAAWALAVQTFKAATATLDLAGSFFKYVLFGDKKMSDVWKGFTGELRKIFKLKGGGGGGGGHGHGH